MLLLHIFNELFIFREPVWKSYRIDLPENVIGRLIGKKGSGLAKYKKIPGVQKVYINLEMKHYGECYLEVTADTISTCNRVYEEVKKKIAFFSIRGNKFAFDHTTANFDAIRLQNFDQVGSEAVFFGKQYRKILVVSSFINHPATVQDSFEPDVSSNYFDYNAKNLESFFDCCLSELELSDSFKLNLTMKVGKIFYMTDREYEEIDLEKSELIKNKQCLNSTELEFVFSPRLNPIFITMEDLEENFEKLGFEEASDVCREADMIVDFEPRHYSATFEKTTISVSFLYDIHIPKISKLSRGWTRNLIGISEAPVDWRASLFLERNETEEDELPEGIEKVLDECWNHCNSSEELSQNDSEQNEYPIGTESWKIVCVEQIQKTKTWVKNIDYDDIDETSNEKLRIKVLILDY